MSRPRVVFLAWAPFFSGAERALVLTLQSLSRYEPVVLAGTDGDFAAQIRALNLPCHIVPLRQLDLKHPIASGASVARVSMIARRAGASLIHANDVPSFQPGGYAARWLGVPAITHVRFPDNAAGYGWFLRSRFTRALFVSQALMDFAVGEAPGVFAGRSAVLHDCVLLQERWSADRQAACRRDLGLPVEATIVALTGQIAEIKGIWDFVEAAAHLAPRGQDPFFAVLGDDLKTGGRLRREMEARVAALGLTSRFAFLGFRTDAPQIVRAFDIIAVPSHVEPLGNATLEAMAAGLPVIGSRVGGIPEMVVDGVTGLLVPPSNPVALADAIAKVAGDPAFRRRLADAAHARARDAFGMHAHGARLEAHYDEVRGLRAAGGDAQT